MGILEKLSAPDANENRVQLGREVANLFFAAEKRGMDTEQRDEFGYILCHLLNSMEIDDRESISTRMAVSENAPHAVVLQMAHDEISVAAPVLQQSVVLTDDDLIDISAAATMDHRLALSQRENLSERVTDELIRHDEMPVMRAVASNPTSAISTSGYQRLGARGANDAGLAEQLAKRANLPPEVAHAIMPNLDARAKKNLMELLAGYDTALERVVDTARDANAKNVLANRSKRLQAKAMSKEIENGSKTLEEVTLRLAQELRVKDLALVFSDISMLSESKTFHAITDGDGDLLALICRAFDMSFGVYAEVEKMRRTLLRLPAKGMDGQQARYESVTVQSAQKTMRFVNIVATAS